MEWENYFSKERKGMNNQDYYAELKMDQDLENARDVLEEIQRLHDDAEENEATGN